MARLGYISHHEPGKSLGPNAGLGRESIFVHCTVEDTNVVLRNIKKPAFRETGLLSRKRSTFERFIWIITEITIKQCTVDGLTDRQTDGKY